MIAGYIWYITLEKCLYSCHNFFSSSNLFVVAWIRILCIIFCGMLTIVRIDGVHAMHCDNGMTIDKHVFLSWCTWIWITVMCYFTFTFCLHRERVLIHLECALRVCDAMFLLTLPFPYQQWIYKINPCCAGILKMNNKLTICLWINSCLLPWNQMKFVYSNVF